ncbi:zinc-binding alcohol dehydrogenase [Nocardioides kongjuensis]|uniref:NADPH:quinone reductase-like Zn-dependent oxidoreductase n=1 Tax=Nocardioides kongjuensis TaxID=349522 RepID=A0A852RXG9_9ACTN|nr:zinc-binding alcohol dehydrogenase [Nocardioides kongjuensis]NYD31232.1 NADPH:quinone reductase-like Zn-dependent oxidoreductase [Nocardioides kongjuensis]
MVGEAPSQAAAYWITEPGHGEVRPVPLREPRAGEVLVRTVRSAISRGTESLVHGGRVPASQHAVMRAPFQEGELPGPVKYGYLSVGVVERGPEDLVGRTVFCLHPHQTAYVVPATAVVPVPDGVPAGRAVLAGTVETALNALWDVPPLIGDRITVVGAGLVGCCLARLAAGVPGVRVTLVDTDPGRAEVAAALGVAFAGADDDPGRSDLVVHTSATEAGLRRALELVAPEGTVLDLSWYGDRPVSLPLGEAFHSSRLTLRSSQVGMVAPARRDSRSHRDRLALALELLRDPGFDVLLTGCSPFRELPEVMARIAAGSMPGLCHLIDYSHERPDHEEA